MKFVKKYLDKRIKSFTEKYINDVPLQYIFEIKKKLSDIKMAQGRIETRQIKNIVPVDVKDIEFKVFSQWGEDGIIQYLISKVPIERPIFIEFGVEDYKEANTRFLLQNNKWNGLVIDGSQDNINYIKADEIYWRYNLKAESAFIDKININPLIENAGITGDIGLLSIDIDGNDYWIWDCINTISPRIVICEYNSLWGDERKVTIPYEREFVRNKSHYSDLYYGASISALVDLADKKGYSLVFSNSNGNNLFFVRNDLVGDLKVLSVKEAYKRPTFRESKGKDGSLTFLNYEESKKLINEKQLYDLDTQKFIKVSEI